MRNGSIISSLLTSLDAHLLQEYSEKLRSDLSHSLGVTCSENQPIIWGILERGIAISASATATNSAASKSSPNTKSEEKISSKTPSSDPKREPEEKESVAAEKSHGLGHGLGHGLSDKQNQSSHTLKPVSNTRHRKGSHGHGDGLDPFGESDLEASTSSLSSVNSLGSSKGAKGYHS
jgi:hypothetical protein